MKPKLLLGAAALAFTGLTAPQIASAAANAMVLPGLDMPPSAHAAWDDDGMFLIARQGRGRGGDENRSGGGNDDNRGRGRGADDGNKGGNGGGGNTSGSGRSKPRIPGGSGCDDAGDVLEHPECSG